MQQRDHAKGLIHNMRLMWLLVGSISPQCCRGPEDLRKSRREPAGTRGARCPKNVCDISCAHEAFDHEGVYAIGTKTWERMAIDIGITSEKSVEKATHGKNVA